MSIDINIIIKADKNLEDILKYGFKLLEGIKIKEDIKKRDKKENKIKQLEKNENTIKEDESVLEITLEDLRKLAKDISIDGKKEKVKNVLETFGTESISTLPEEKYKEFYERLVKL